jgi:hypothetical protein
MAGRAKGDSNGPRLPVRPVPARAFVVEKDDLTDEEIDRIYQQRLQAIRQQRLFRTAELRWGSSLEGV